MRVRDRSFAIILGQATVQASGIAAAVILVRIVSQETYGSYRQVLLVYTTLANLLSLQLDQSLYYFVPKLVADARRSLVAQSLLYAVALALLTGAVMFAAAGSIADYFDNPALTRLLRVFALFPVVEGVALLVPAYMIGLDRAIRGGIYNVLKSLLRLAGVVSVFASGGSVESALWVVMGASALVATVGTADMVRVGAGRFRVRREMLAEQLSYTFPLWMGSAVGTLNLQYDNLLISTAFDPAAYAIYFCGAMELPVVTLVTASISAAMMPRLVSLVRDQPGEALDLWQEGIRKASLLVFPCFAFFLPASRDFMVLLYGEDYARAAWPFAIYLCLLPIRVAVYSTVFRALGETLPLAVGGVIALGVNVVMSTALVLLGEGTLLAFVGPSIGTVFAQVSGVVYLLFRLRASLQVPIRRLMRWSELARTAVPCAGAGLAMLAFGAVLPPMPVIAKLPLQLVLFALLLIAAAAAMGLLHEDERELLKAPFRLVSRARSGRD